MKEKIKIAAVHPDTPAVQKLVQDTHTEFATPVTLYLTTSESFTQALKQYDYLQETQQAGVMDLDPAAIEALRPAALAQG